MTKEVPSYLPGQADTIVNVFATRTVADSAAYLRPVLQPHMKILDVGCGPGSITIDLARHAPQGHVTGVDTEVASETLNKARAQAAKEGVANVTFAVADGLSLPFADGTFDVVHSHQVIQYVDDPVHFLRELHRVAKPGGFVAVRTWDLGLFAFHPKIGRMDESVEIMVRTFRATGREPYAGRNLHVWARKAGFDPVKMRISSSNEIRRTPEERKIFSPIAKHFSTKSDIAKVAVRKGIVTEEQLKETERAHDEWEANEDGWHIAVHVEMLVQV